MNGLAVGLTTVVVVLGACGPIASKAPPDVQRATRGPTAEEVFLARFARNYGRLPTFDEQLVWKEETEARILKYLSMHRELATAPLASQIRFHRMVIVGMRKNDVLALLGQPDRMTKEAADMRAAAGHFWTVIGAQADEMWTYPVAWALYFEQDVLVDATVGDRRALQ